MPLSKELYRELFNLEDSPLYTSIPKGYEIEDYGYEKLDYYNKIKLYYRDGTLIIPKFYK